MLPKNNINGTQFCSIINLKAAKTSPAYRLSENNSKAAGGTHAVTHHINCLDIPITLGISAEQTYSALEAIISFRG